MNSVTYQAFVDEIEKIAWDAPGMGKILSLAKSRMLKLPSRRLVEMGSGPFELPEKLHGAQVSGIQGALSSGAITPEQAEEGLRFLNQAKGKGVVPKGGMIHHIQDMAQAVGAQWSPTVGGLPATPLQRKAIEAQYAGHMLDELQLGNRLTRKDMPVVSELTHAKPDVVPRERNRALTSPEEVRSALLEHFAPARAPESHLLERATRGVSGRGVEYSTGPRFSRHARRHISQRMGEIALSPDTLTIGKAMRGEVPMEAMHQAYGSMLPG